MTISKDLFLAILSLDSYNRGYGAGLADNGANDPDGLGESGKVGAATILTRTDTGISESKYTEWKDAGFYAISYTVGSGVDGIDSGTTVISYRGTDVFITKNPHYGDSYRIKRVSSAVCS